MGSSPHDDAGLDRMIHGASHGSAISLGILGRDQLDWLKKNLAPLGTSTPIVFAHVPLWGVYATWGWGTTHGDEGPDLHYLTASNPRIATTIKHGVKGEMPAFAKKYDERQIAALVSYLRSLD